eukprot:JP436295.1.p1 GENE.JP436295.1~~JP436295.1.p1  ORF type:complete len:239 (-),score=61.79 JP436295.1:150-866(-)
MSDSSLVYGLFTQECFQELQKNFLHLVCLKALLSKVLGYGVVAGSVIYKVPQIRLLYNTKSGSGVSAVMLHLEALSCSISVSYGLRNHFPVSTFGESLFMALQNFIILAMLSAYSTSSAVSATILCLGQFAIFAGMYSLCTLEQLSLLQSGIIFLTITSRLPQIVSNFRTKNVNNLSFITWMLNFAGGLARVFTTMQELSNEKTLLYIYTTSSALNGIIVFQIIFYTLTGLGSRSKKE